MSDTLTPKSPEIEKELHPLPRMGSGYSNQGGATSENKHICDALLVEEGDRLASPSKQLLEYARGLKNEARLHNIAIGNIIKKLDEFMSHLAAKHELQRRKQSHENRYRWHYLWRTKE